jgi:alkanesulfonate monooxygenase SsuD/methylene tetrahydromethanopterin reductase-like flavin-dependent oxidoreductase (luciferase family)
MKRQFFYFSEMGYNAYPIEAAEKYGYTNLMFPNSIFDRENARDLWQMFLREHEYAFESGFDGAVCNEHHNTVLSMQESVNISAAVLTQRIKGTIALVGNPIPIHDNSVRVAEEIAMLDLISGGRIISGFVRGGGVEQLSTNANPAYNRERFEEAFELIMKAWTVPGPFRWEGKHYHLRVVNPWQLPLQKPHPPIRAISCSGHAKARSRTMQPCAGLNCSARKSSRRCASMRPRWLPGRRSHHGRSEQLFRAVDRRGRDQGPDSPRW